MFVTVLGRIHGVTPDQYDYTVFADAPRDSWFGPYVSWAYSIRIVDGYVGATMMPIIIYSLGSLGNRSISILPSASLRYSILYRISFSSLLRSCGVIL